MKLKPILYLTILFLAAAIVGAILKFFFYLQIGSLLFSLGMNGTQLFGLILVVVNGSAISNNKLIIRMALAACIALVGYIAQTKFAFRNVGLALQLIGLGFVLASYLASFLAKSSKEVLDYLKVIWLSSKIFTSILVVVSLKVATSTNQIANILFYTMLFHFIWLALSHRIVNPPSASI